MDEKILSIAFEKIEKDQLTIPLIQYDGISIPFAEGHFDRVISSLVFHHLSDYQKATAFSEILRVLITGGRLHFADWGLAWRADADYVVSSANL